MPSAHESIVLREIVTRIQNNVSPDEWTVLFNLASGATYQDLAPARGCTEQTLKTRVSRCRKRLKAMCA